MGWIQGAQSARIPRNMFTGTNFIQLRGYSGWLQRRFWAGILPSFLPWISEAWSSTQTPPLPPLILCLRNRLYPKLFINRACPKVWINNPTVYICDAYWCKFSFFHKRVIANRFTLNYSTSKDINQQSSCIGICVTFTGANFNFSQKQNRCQGLPGRVVAV